MARPKKPTSFTVPEADRFLIAEQPGMALLLTGFLIALFVGLLFRAAIAPGRVKSQIEKAAAQIHREVQVSFESAEVSLSDGILPRFSVLINNVVMDSSQECWMRPLLETNQIRLPLSVWGMLSGGSVIREIEADQVKLTLRGIERKCGEESKNSASGSIASTPSPAKLIALEDSGDKAKNNKTNAIHALSFSSLQIEWLGDPRAHLEFQDVEFQVQSFDPRWYVLKAKTSLFKDEQVGDYLSHANLHIEYKESPDQMLQAHFFGNWREGHYSVIANYNLVDRQLILENDLKHIPLSQMINLAQRYEWVNPSLNPKNIWLSLHSSFAGDPAKLTKTPWQVSDLHLEGDIGDIRVDQIQFQSLDPVRYDAIHLELQRLNLQKLLDLFLMDSPSKIFGHLGEFTGRAEMASAEQMKVFGDWSGLEFIFSNKGRRELQVIQKIRADARLDKNRWDLDLSRIEPLQGSFEGSLHVNADTKWKDMDLRLRLEEAVLSPAVQKLMAQDGKIGPLTSQIDFSVVSGKLTKLKGQIKAKDMDIEGVRLNSARAQLDFVKNEIVVGLQGEGMEVKPESTAMKTLGFLREDSGASLEFKNFAGQFRTLDFRTLAWKNFAGRLSDNSRLSTDGGWDEGGRLQGQVHLRGPSSHRQWEIRGTREVPQITDIQGER